MTLLSVEGLTVDVPVGGRREALVSDVSFVVGRGETVGLVGESGCGKSTTALALLGLLPWPVRRAAGSVVLDGVDLYGLRRKGWEDVRGVDISMIFQEPMSSLHPAFTIGEQIAETLRRHLGLGGKAARERAVELLDLVGVPDARARAQAYPHEFSGGMLQRVLIAIALACEPKLLVADEPTTALDVTVQAQILDLLHELRERFELAILLVTHDLGVVAEVCDRVVVMYAGQVIEDAPVREFLHDARHPYSQALLDASRSTAWIPGAPPAAEAMPPGCRFHPRCGHVRAECSRALVPLRSVAGRTFRCLYEVGA